MSNPSKISKISKATQQAHIFLGMAEKYGFTVEVKESIVTITKTFTPGDYNTYITCDMFGPSVLSYAPLKGGSEWGTDGASVGGAIGLKNGEYRLNKSGSGKAFTSALKKILNSEKERF